jgi:hypothetical protein
MTRRLQVTLYVVAAYLAIFGILFLFAPGVFEQITQSKLADPKLTLLYGQYTLTFAIVAFFGYLLVSGMERFSQAGPPAVVNFILSVLLFLFRRK